MAQLAPGPQRAVAGHDDVVLVHEDWAVLAEAPDGRLDRFQVLIRVLADVGGVLGHLTDGDGQSAQAGLDVGQVGAVGRVLRAAW